MDALLLAAGHGTRMLPITEEIPKPLIPVLNIPLIEIQLRNLARFGFDNLAINSFHLAKRLEEAVAKMNIPKTKIHFSREEKLLGTGGGIKRMLSSSKEEMILVSNTDAIYDLDLYSAVDKHLSSGASVTLILIPLKKNAKYSRVTIDKEGMVKDFHAKDPSGPYRSGFFSGIHIINRKELPKFPDKEAFCIIDDYYSHLIASGFRIRGEFTKGSWMDAGDMGKYFDANMALLADRSKFPFMDGIIKKNYIEYMKGIFIHKKSELDTHFDIKAPAIIGSGVKIGEKADLGPFAVIGDYAEIGPSVRISNSVVLPSEKLPQDTILKKGIFFKKPIPVQY